MLISTARYVFRGEHTDLILREQIALGESDPAKWPWIVEEENPSFGVREIFRGTADEAGEKYESLKTQYR